MSYFAKCALDVVAAVSVSCGAAPRQAPVATPDRDLSAPLDGATALQDLREHDGALDAMLRSADCGGACRHLSALCTLSKQICELASARPDQVSAMECVDAAQRCVRATERVSAQCQCE